MICFLFVLSIVLVHFLCVLFSFPSEQQGGENWKSPYPTTPYQNYWCHKRKIHDKYNNIIKKVPIKIVIIYVAFHICNDKQIWCITTGHAGMSNSNQTVEDIEPKPADGSYDLDFYKYICSFKFSHELDMKENFEYFSKFGWCGWGKSRNRFLL